MHWSMVRMDITLNVIPPCHLVDQRKCAPSPSELGTSPSVMGSSNRQFRSPVLRNRTRVAAYRVRLGVWSQA